MPEPRTLFRRISGADGRVRQVIIRANDGARDVDITLTRETLGGLLEALASDLQWINGRVELN